MLIFLKEISEMLDKALDSEQTDADESFALLYEISDKLEEQIEKLEEMHQSKIKVLRMYKTFIGGWRVEYVLENKD